MKIQLKHCKRALTKGHPASSLSQCGGRWLGDDIEVAKLVLRSALLSFISSETLAWDARGFIPYTKSKVHSTSKSPKSKLTPHRNRKPHLQFTKPKAKPHSTSKSRKSKALEFPKPKAKAQSTSKSRKLKAQSTSKSKAKSRFPQIESQRSSHFHRYAWVPVQFAWVPARRSLSSYSNLSKVCVPTPFWDRMVVTSWSFFKKKLIVWLFGLSENCKLVWKMWIFLLWSVDCMVV